MQKRFSLPRRGFTLIELMVVISVIAILASLIIANLTKSRTKAEDRKLATEVNSLRQALELYYTKYGYYPATSGAYSCTAGTGTNSCTPGTNVLQVLVTEGFISKVPTAKGADGNSVDENEIYYGSPGWWNASWGYQIQFQVANRNDSLGECYFNDCAGSSVWNGKYMYSVHP